MVTRRILARKPPVNFRRILVVDPAVLEGSDEEDEIVSDESGEELVSLNLAAEELGIKLYSLKARIKAGKGPDTFLKMYHGDELPFIRRSVFEEWKKKNGYDYSLVGLGGRV